MTVGIARVTLFIPGSHSLKEKRMVLRRLKDSAREKFNVAVAEVGANDVWQRAVLGLAVVGGERHFVDAALDEVLRFLRAKAEATQAEVTAEERDVQTFGDEVSSAFRHWEG